ncbi:MAG: hypothetical protein HN991_00815 [Candidatus Jacksonbacteria bacterium]|nr:hypothetical protein [Candidatus Jacksonbacteria bacterium]
MYKEVLNQAGLSQDQAEIYEILLKNGALTAGKINQNTPIKRGLVYKLLDQLMEFGLVEKEEDPGKVALFKPNHPLKIKDLAKNREQQAKDAQRVLEGVIPSLVSDFNLISGKPGVQFFEGKEAFKAITDDSLTAKEAIYSYADNDAVNKYAAKENAEYAKKREKRGVEKKLITTDSEFIRNYLKEHKGVTDIKVIDMGDDGFETVIMIYDNKVSYLTLNKDSRIGVIITDPWICKMHRTLFEHQWKQLKSLDDNTAPSPSSIKELDESNKKTPLRGGEIPQTGPTRMA